MELLAKKSDSRVIHRQNNDGQSPAVSKASESDQGETNIDELVKSANLLLIIKIINRLFFLIILIAA